LINTHLGIKQAGRDDIESLNYLVLRLRAMAGSEGQQQVSDVRSCQGEEAGYIYRVSLQDIQWSSPSTSISAATYEPMNGHIMQMLKELFIRSGC
jgi:hypothetical protein